MSQIKRIAVAIIAFAAITATTASTAVAEPGFLPKANFIGTGTGILFASAVKGSVACVLNLLSGIMETDPHGTADLHYEKCKAFGSFAAKSLGDPSETILAPSLWLLCLIEPKTLVWGFWIESKATVHVEAGGKLLEYTGGDIGTVTPNAKSLKKTITFKQKNGVSEPAECTGTDGKVKKVSLLVAEDGKAPETSALGGTFTIEAADKKTEIEIMDS